MNLSTLNVPNGRIKDLFNRNDSFHSFSIVDGISKGVRLNVIHINSILTIVETLAAVFYLSK